ncbi:MAG: 1,4-alpha-glucan branching protein GlgB, partial [Planctomycetaceae bacterium]|nr:1,4-alpha-glucan branching protein GlgB [Planctomycetaceae bacterium]
KQSDLRIYVWLPRAVTAWVETGSEKIQLTPSAPKGFFTATIPDTSSVSVNSFICFTDSSGYICRRRNPYAFEPRLSREDIYLYGEGTSYNSYRKFGAHSVRFGEIPGTQFVLWAPNAKAVSVIGNFNHWNAGEHPMQRMHGSGYWALFIPDLKPGEYYKFAVKTQHDRILEKSDPYAFASELRPHTASVVVSSEPYEWKDADWIRRRSAKNFMREPFSVYEVHLGSWMRTGEGGAQFLDYRALAHKLVNHVKRLGFTHIELMPVMEHPLDQSWGYQVLGYFSPTRRFGTPDDFKYFVDYCHQHDIGVLLDWVPAHFPKDEHGLNCFDGQQIYAYQDWQRAEHQDWGTLVFDYGRGEVKSFLISSAMYWIDQYHLDGLRVDAVASMIYLDYSREYGQWNPNQHGGNENLEAIDFVKRFNEALHGSFPGILTIAEESTAYPCVSRPTWMNGLGFSMKWNMGWMHDSLKFFSKNPIHRRYHMNDITFPLIYAFHENFVLPISHDEVVHGKQSLLHKMPGDEWQQAANFRLYLGYMFSQPGKKLLFMVQEFAQGNEWNSNQSLDWHVMEYKRHFTADRLTADV